MLPTSPHGGLCYPVAVAGSVRARTECGCLMFGTCRLGRARSRFTLRGTVGREERLLPQLAATSLLKVELPFRQDEFPQLDAFPVGLVLPRKCPFLTLDEFLDPCWIDSRALEPERGARSELEEGGDQGWVACFEGEVDGRRRGGAG